MDNFLEDFIKDGENRYWSVILMSFLKPFLKRGFTLACFNSSGKTPVDKEVLIIITRGSAIKSAIALIM